MLERGAQRAAAPAPIAYFGASVTAQRRDAYRPLLHAALCTAFGRPHRPVLAAVGGVGSISGLFLLDQLVLRHRPGLCFVEFATTDMVGLTPPSLLEPVLVSLVARLRSDGCEPCFLLLGRQDSDGTQEHVLDTYREVAAIHSVACVDLAQEFSSDPTLFRDVVHTTAKGAERIAMRTAAAVGPAPPDLGPVPPASQARLFADARVVPARTADLAEPEAGEEGILGGLFPYVACTPGNAHRVEPDGELLGLVVTVGPTAGGVEIDAQPAAGGAHRERAVLWDRMCHYERLSTLILADPVPAGTPVSVAPVNIDIDYSTAHKPPADPAGIEQDLRLIGYMVR